MKNQDLIKDTHRLVPILRKHLDRAMSVEELRTLCFDLNIDYENLPHGRGTKNAKIRELILYLQQRNRLGDLIRIIENERPEIIDFVRQDFEIESHIFSSDTQNEERIDIYVPYFQLPSGYVDRPDIIEPLVKKLAGEQESLAVIRGPAGIGKTTLAYAVSNHPEIHNKFGHNILFIELGENPQKDPIEYLLDLIYRIDGEQQTFRTIESAQSRLNELFFSTPFLLVIDDVWSANHLLPFLGYGSNCTRLVTTRFYESIPRRFSYYSVSVLPMSSAQSVDILRWQLVDYQYKDLENLAQMFNHWPLFLRIANGILVGSAREGEKFADTYLYIKSLVEEVGFRGFEDQESQKFDHFFSAAIMRLGQIEADLFERLAIFPPETDIQISLLEWIWSEISSPLIRQVCTKLDSSSLLRLDVRNKSIRLHAIIRSYLVERVGQKTIKLHRQFTDNLFQNQSSESILPTQEPYMWRELAYHLKAANRLHDLKTLLFNYQFLQEKIQKLSLDSILRDCAFLENDREIQLLASALRLSAHVISLYPEQLAEQLRCRLQMHTNFSRIELFSDSLPQEVGTFHSLLPAKTLTYAGGALLRTLSGHGDDICGMAFLQDGRILSWSDDHTLRLWESDGYLIDTFYGHNDCVNGAIELPDGQILSWSDDHTLIIWQRDGTFLRRLSQHASIVNGALLVSNQNILSWSDDHTLIVWSNEGEFIQTLQGHTEQVEGALELAEGRILSWSTDNNLIVWDLVNSTSQILRGHTARIVGALALDNEILSWSADNTVRLWDLARNKQVVFEGHHALVNGVVQLEDKTILSWSADGNLIRWNKKGSQITKFQGHLESVTGALGLSDETILSWSDDNTLRRWKQDGVELSQFIGHRKAIVGSLEFSESQIVSWSDDSTLIVWDFEGNLLSTLRGHAHYVNGVKQLGSDRLISWSEDFTLRLWNPFGDPVVTPSQHKSRVKQILSWENGFISSSTDGTIKVWDKHGQEMNHFDFHHASVNGLYQLDEAHFISWSSDKTIKQWSLAGHLIHTFVGHDSFVNGCLLWRENQLVSWGADRSIRIWNDKEACIEILDAHDSYVNGVLAINEKMLLSWSEDNTLKMWNDGKLVTTLLGHRMSVDGALYVKKREIFVSWSADQTIRLWDVSGENIMVLRGHRQRVIGVSLLGQDQLISWAGDGTIRLWSLDGNLLESIQAHRGGINHLIVLKDRRFITCSLDNTIKIWDCTSLKSVARYCTDWPVATIAASGPTPLMVAAGDYHGRILFLQEVVGGPK